MTLERALRLFHRTGARWAAKLTLPSLRARSLQARAERTRHPKEPAPPAQNNRIDQRKRLWNLPMSINNYVWQSHSPRLEPEASKLFQPKDRQSTFCGQCLRRRPRRHINACSCVPVTGSEPDSVLGPSSASPSPVVTTNPLTAPVHLYGTRAGSFTDPSPRL